MYANAKGKHTSDPKGHFYAPEPPRFKLSKEVLQAPSPFSQVCVSLDKATFPFVWKKNIKPTHYKIFDKLINVFDLTESDGDKYIFSICDKISLMDGHKFNFIIHPRERFDKQRITVQACTNNGRVRAEKQFLVEKEYHGEYLVFVNAPSLRAERFRYWTREDLKRLTALNYTIEGEQWVANHRESDLITGAGYCLFLTLSYVMDYRNEQFYNLANLIDKLRYHIKNGTCCNLKEKCRCKKYAYDIVEEQVDDFGANLKTTVANTHNSSASHKKLTATSALNMVDTPMSIQGIETVDVVTGSERTITTLTTPDGPRDVIHLSNTAIKPNHKISYMPSTFLPTAAYVWNPATQTSATFNNRTAYYMAPYGEYHCQYIFRILAKPSLFTNSRVWVSLKDTTTVGFEWSPAEENDIYVLVPWQAQDLTKPTNELTCPALKITDLSSTIYATGTSTTIDYSIFVAPFNMFLYRPIPVGNSIATTSPLLKAVIPFSDLVFSPDTNYTAFTKKAQFTANSTGDYLTTIAFNSQPGLSYRIDCEDVTSQQHADGASDYYTSQPTIQTGLKTYTVYVNDELLTKNQFVWIFYVANMDIQIISPDPVEEEISVYNGLDKIFRVTSTSKVFDVSNNTAGNGQRSPNPMQIWQHAYVVHSNLLDSEIAEMGRQNFAYSSPSKSFTTTKDFVFYGQKPTAVVTNSSGQTVQQYTVLPAGTYTVTDSSNGTMYILTDKDQALDQVTEQMSTTSTLTQTSIPFTDFNFDPSPTDFNFECTFNIDSTGDYVIIITHVNYELSRYSYEVASIVEQEHRSASLKITPSILRGSHNIELFCNDTGALFVSVFHTDPITVSQPAADMDIVCEQIMELSYTDNFKVNHKIIGKPGPHTVHVDSHWNFITKLDFNTAADSVFFPVAVDQAARSRRDFQKYNQYSKYPVVQFTAASIPTSNALFRITQDPSGYNATTTTLMSLDDALQLPGVEWDPKTGPLFLQPYWDSEYPTRYTEDDHTIVYHIHILAGTLTEPISVVAKVNYASVEYHNYFIDHASFAIDPVVEQIEEFEPTKTPGTTENLTAVGEVNVSDAVEVENAAPFVNTVDDQTQEKVTGLASRYEFVHSTTFGPDTAVFYYAINYNMLGRDAFDEYIGYEYFTGKPRFKLCMSCGTATAADAHVVQVPPSVDVPNLTYDDWIKIIKSRPSGAVAVRDGDYEVEMEWMVPEVRASRNTFLGYLAVVMPYSNQFGTTTNAPDDIIMSLFTDSGNVSFLVDRVNTSSADDTYIEPVFDTLVRAAPTVRRHRGDHPLDANLSANVHSLVALLRNVLGSGTSFLERGVTLDSGPEALPFIPLDSASAHSPEC